MWKFRAECEELGEEYTTEYVWCTHVLLRPKVETPRVWHVTVFLGDGYLEC